MRHKEFNGVVNGVMVSGFVYLDVNGHRRFSLDKPLECIRRDKLTMDIYEIDEVFQRKNYTRVYLNDRKNELIDY